MKNGGTQATKLNRDMLLVQLEKLGFNKVYDGNLLVELFLNTLKKDAYRYLAEGLRKDFPHVFKD